ncbi:hypothetical protein EC988_000671 [Linderina pennispora]|nr:hypothetical protein EC988_000671 [Linderina pennispora]
MHKSGHENERPPRQRGSGSKKQLFDPATSTMKPASNRRNRATPAVPTILARPADAPAKTTTSNGASRPVQLLVRQHSAPPSQAVPATPAPARPATSASGQPRPAPPRIPSEKLFPERALGKKPLISASGRLDLQTARKYLGSVQLSSTVGVIGTQGVGKSLVMAQLAGPYSSRIFGADRTLGVDFWVAGAGVLLVDTPPMLASRVRSAGMPRARKHEEKRDYANDLQLATLMLQICDTLLVVTDAPAANLPLAQLLASAADMVPNIPGLRPPSRPAQAADKATGCALHIVVNCHSTTACGAVVDKKKIALTYERLTSIRVSDVTVLGSLDTKQPADSHVQIARQWADPQFSLYPSFHSPRSLVSWDEACMASHGGTLRESHGGIEELRRAVMYVRRPLEAEGAWLAKCVRAWESIRRSAFLLEAAGGSLPSDSISEKQAEPAPTGRRQNRGRNRGASGRRGR